MTREMLKELEDVNELRLSEAETEQVLKIFDTMTEEEAAMAEINTENVEIMVHVMPLENIFREDNHEQRFSRERLLEGAPEHTEDSWQVPMLVK